MVELYNGVIFDNWAQEQTLNPPISKTIKWFSDYETLSYHWYDMGIPEIPLDIRFKNFQERLKQCCDKHGLEYRG